jgi:hypothetical protein
VTGERSDERQDMTHGPFKIAGVLDTQVPGCRPRQRRGLH